LVQEFPNLVKPIECNLRNWAETEKVVGNIEPLDHLVNNAGVAYRENLFEIQSDTFDEIFDVNVKALINVSKIVAKKMAEAGKQGSIVNVSSVSAIKQGSGLLSYCASKAAVDMITKCCAMELSTHKIRVNSVNPTIVMTDMGHELWDGITKQALAKIPLGKFAECSHCTNAILFLLSDLAGMTTGEFFLVDGGYAAS